MPIPETGAPNNGRALEIGITPPTGSGVLPFVLNCTGDVPTAPGQNDPSTEIQSFQGGDYVAVTQDGGYKPSTYTCEKTKELYEAIDQLRANVTPCSVKLGGDGFTGKAHLNVSEGPTLPANGSKIETMTVQATWVSTKAPTKTPAKQ